MSTIANTVILVIAHVVCVFCISVVFNLWRSGVLVTLPWVLLGLLSGVVGLVATEAGRSRAAFIVYLVVLTPISLVCLLPVSH